MSGLDQVHPELVQRFLSLQAAAAAAGFEIGITSGYRTPAEQISLRRRNGCPDVWSSPASSCTVPTAIPGQSNHNHGLAIDISGSAEAKAWVGANAARFGLHLPVPGEDWHLEMLEDAVSGPIVAAFPDAIGFDLTWAERPGDPMEIVNERVDMLMNTLAGANQEALLESPITQLIGSPTEQHDGRFISSPDLRRDLSHQRPTQREEELRRRVVATLGGQAMRWEGPGNTPPPGYIPQGDDPVGRWRDVAIAALQYTGQDPAYADLLLQRMRQESAGDPFKVNKWDRNWRQGDPSKGLMQNIGSAFPDRARELAGRGIYDGFANIVASIRYTLQRYGTLDAWGRPGGY